LINVTAMGNVENRLYLLNETRIAVLTTVADDSGSIPKTGSRELAPMTRRSSRPCR